ncbi:MAG: hypothetical protein ACLVJZ_07920 [[Clostridium] leptum]
MQNPTCQLSWNHLEVRCDQQHRRRDVDTAVNGIRGGNAVSLDS